MTIYNSYVLSRGECWAGVPCTVTFKLLKVESWRIYFWGDEVDRRMLSGSGRGSGSRTVHE